MHICPMCTGAAVTAVSENAPLVYLFARRIWRRIKHWAVHKMHHERSADVQSV